MYFFEVIYRVISAIGFGSLAVFIGSVLMLLDQEKHEEFGTASLLTLHGGWLFGSLPVALTMNGGKGPDILFWLGVTTIPSSPGRRWPRNSRSAKPPRKSMSRSYPPTQLIELDPASPVQAAYRPAPAALNQDFDVPPQR